MNTIPRWGWAVVIYVWALAWRMPSLQDTFATSDHVQHALAGMNLDSLPWITADLRHSKLGFILTYPYGLVALYTSLWSTLLSAGGAPLTERPLSAFVALVGSSIGPLSFLWVERRVSRAQAILFALIVSAWDMNVYRSLTPSSLVLSLGAVGILSTLILLDRLQEKGRRQDGIFLAMGTVLHFMSCQTALCLAPLWAWKVGKAREKKGFLWTMISTASALAALITLYVLASHALHNPYVTVVGKLFSKGVGSPFDLGFALQEYVWSMGLGSFALALVALVLFALKKLWRDHSACLLLAAATLYFIPLTKLSHSTYVAAYAYESQFLLHLFTAYVLIRWAPLQLGLTTAITLALSLTGFPPRLPAFGIYREYVIHPGTLPRAMGVLYRERYAGRKAYTELEPLLSHYYFGAADVLGVYDADNEINGIALDHALAAKNPALVSIVRNSLWQSRAQASVHCVDARIIDRSGNILAVAIDGAQRGPCNPVSFSVDALAAKFPHYASTVKRLLPSWIPFLPMDMYALGILKQPVSQNPLQSPEPPSVRDTRGPFLW